MRKPTLAAAATVLVLALIAYAAMSGGRPPETPAQTTTTQAPAPTATTAPRPAAAGLYTITEPPKNTTVEIHADPTSAHVVITSRTYVNGTVAETRITINFTESAGTTTEIVIIGGIISRATITAVGSGTEAVLIFPSTTATDTHWTPLMYQIFTPFTPYAVIGSTTYFTAPGDVLETTTLTEWGTAAVIKHSYTKIAGGKTYMKTVIMTATMRGYRTEVLFPVYTTLITPNYPWIEGTTAIIPTLLVDGIIEHEETVTQGKTTSIVTEFFTIEGATNPTRFTGYQYARVTKVSGTTMVVYYGGAEVTGAYTSGSYVITLRPPTTATTSTVVTVSAYPFYIVPTPAGASTIAIDGRPILVAWYTLGNLTFTVTFGINYALMKGAYKLYTAENAYIIINTFALYSMSIVRATTAPLNQPQSTKNAVTGQNTGGGTR